MCDGAPRYRNLRMQHAWSVRQTESAQWPSESFVLVCQYKCFWREMLAEIVIFLQFSGLSDDLNVFDCGEIAATQLI